jgi:hypothetical protein
MQSINNTIEYSFPVIDSISQHTKHLKYKPNMQVHDIDGFRGSKYMTTI